MNNRMRVMTLALTALLLTGGLAAAQDSDYLPFAWEAADLSLLYPAAWEAPVPAERDGALVLTLAQSLAALTDARPPEIPAITLTLLPAAGSDLAAGLLNALDTLGITADGDPLPALLLGQEDALAADGLSADGALYGLGRAAALPDGQVLVMTGRAGADQRDLLRTVFNRVADSVALGALTFDAPPVYGVAWHTQRSLADGPDAFLNLTGLAFVDGALYTYERDLGLVRLDALTGAVEAVTSNAAVTAPAALAAAPDGTVYVADTVCGCIVPLLPGGDWGDPVGGGLFESGSPLSLAVTPDGTLYATSAAANSVTVKILRDGAPAGDVRLPEGVFEQPLLAAGPDGAPLALTQYGAVIDLNTGDVRAQLGAVPPLLTGFAVTPEGWYALATPDQGLFVLSADGVPLAQPGRIVPAFPFPGELVRPVGLAAGPEGVLFAADSDGSFGAVTAFSTAIVAGRVGTTALTPGLAGRGTLDEYTRQQAWTYAGTAGERISIFAADASETGQLLPAVRLLTPEGREVAAASYAGFDPENPVLDALLYFGAQIADYALESDGVYIIVVERVEGAGVYTIGVSLTRSFALADGAAALAGDLSAAFPVDRWQFEGVGGQTVTLTMRPVSGTLDPQVRLVGPDGVLLAENDDAADPALGSSAQIARVTLAQTGTYTVEAARFTGAGGYELAIVEVTPGE
jgi:hypothetical protein